MLLYILYTKRFGLFQGEKYSNRNKLSLLAGFVLVEKIAGKKLASNMLLGLKIISSPLKMRGYRNLPGILVYQVYQVYLVYLVYWYTWYTRYTGIPVYQYTWYT